MKALIMRAMILPVIICIFSGPGCRKTERMSFDAIVIENNITVTANPGKDAQKAGTLEFFNGIKILQKKGGRVLVKSSSGITGWIDLGAVSSVPADWKEIVIDECITISLPPEQLFKTMNNDPDPEEGGLTEHKFFNENYFINMVHSDENYSESVSQAKTGAAQSGDGSTPRELVLNGLEGVFHEAPADVEGMTVITWTIRGKKNDSYIFSVIIQKERAGGEYEMTARKILFSARARQ